MSLAAAAVDVQTKLAAHLGLALKVGDRIYPGRLPEDPVFPSVEYSLELDVLGRHDEAAAGLAFDVVCEATIYSRATSLEARQIADEFAIAWRTVGGALAGGRYSGARLESADAPEWAGASETWELDLELSLVAQSVATAFPTPLSEWRLGEGSGATAADNVDANDLTLAGTPPWLFGSLRFNAAGDQAGKASPSAALLSDAFTVCATVKWPTGGNAPVLGWDSAAVFPGVYAGLASSAGRPAILMGANIQRVFELASPVDLTDGEWHFLAFSAPGRGTADASSFKLRADGQDQDEFSIAATGGETAKTDFILGEFAGVALAEGYQIAFASFHDRVLTNAEKDQMRTRAAAFTPTRDTGLDSNGEPVLDSNGDFVLINA